MKKIKCGNDNCAGMKQHYSDDAEDYVNRAHQMVKVAEDFDERKMAFCSEICACWAGYMTMNKKMFEDKNGMEIGGQWWLNNGWIKGRKIKNKI